MSIPNKQINWGTESQLIHGLYSQISKLYSSNRNLVDDVGLVDVTDGSTIYLCYPKKGTIDEDSSSWSIQRISVSGSIYIYEWAGGTREKMFKASDRALLNYTFLK